MKVPLSRRPRLYVRPINGGECGQKGGDAPPLAVRGGKRERTEGTVSDVGRR